MVVLVTGVTGLVGYNLFNKIKENCIGISRTASFPNTFPLDLTNKEATRTFLQEHKPTVVYHCAANPNVEYCEDNKEDVKGINLDANRNLTEACKEIGAKLVFTSSDYVFDGKNGPYTEEDTPSPINIYGKHKIETEKIIQSLLEDYLIIRTTVIYGHELQGKNFVVRFVKTLKEGKTITVPIDQFGSPTYVEDLVEAMIELVELEKKGIYNVSGPETDNRYKFALQIAEVFDLDKSLIKPVTSDVLNQRAPRPMKAGLKIDKLIKDLKITKMQDPAQGLQKMKTRAWNK